jgi:uncharacterized protein YhaN
MLYTLVSKIPFVENDNSKKKIFKIFLIGSVLYIFLHYYLHLHAQNEILLKLRQNLYYIMVADFGISWFLSSGKKQDIDEDDNTRDGGYSNNEIKLIQMDQMRRAQEHQQEMQKRQAMISQQYNDNEELETNKSPFKKMNKRDDENEKKASSEKEKKDSSNEDKKKSDKSDETDTCIPVYMNK